MHTNTPLAAKAELVNEQRPPATFQVIVNPSAAPEPSRLAQLEAEVSDLREEVQQLQRTIEQQQVLLRNAQVRERALRAQLAAQER